MLDQADLIDATREFDFQRAAELTGNTDHFLRQSVEKDLMTCAREVENGVSAHMIWTPLKSFSLQVEARRNGKYIQLIVKLVAANSGCLVPRQ